MPSDNFIPAADPAALGQSYANASNSARSLIVLMWDALSPERHAELTRLIDSGGRVGLEITVDRYGQDSINLIGMELEGARHVLMNVNPPAPAVAQH